MPPKMKAYVRVLGEVFPCMCTMCTMCRISAFECSSASAGASWGRTSFFQLFFSGTREHRETGTPIGEACRYIIEEFLL